MNKQQEMLREVIESLTLDIDASDLPERAKYEYAIRVLEEKIRVLDDSYLRNSHPSDFICESGSCEEAVKQNPNTGRWFITIGHCGFNTPANNMDGFQTGLIARKTYHRYLYKK
jgi:hypothetical protein